MGTPVYSQSPNLGVAIDYSTELSQIVTALGRIVTATETSSYNLGRLVAMVSQHSTTCTGSILGTTLTVTNVGAQIYPGSEVLSPPVAANSVTPTIKPGTIILGQLTYTNSPSATVVVTDSITDTLILPVDTTVGIRIGQYVAGQGAGTLSTVANTPIVVNVNPAKNEVTISEVLSADRGDTYTFTDPGRDGTYAVSNSQTVDLTSMVISDLTQGGIAEIIQNNVFKTVNAYDITSPANLIAALNSPMQDIALSEIFRSLPLTDNVQHNIRTINDIMVQFSNLSKTSNIG